MPKGRNNHVTRDVQPFALKFYQLNREYPTAAQVLEALPHLKKHRWAVIKALQVMRKGSPADFAPGIAPADVALSMPKASTKLLDGEVDLASRLANIQAQLRMLDERAQEGSIDPLAYDKLTRLERDVQKWIKLDEQIEAEQASQSGDNPFLESMMSRYQQRKQQGLTPPRPAANA